MTLLSRLTLFHCSPIVLQLFQVEEQKLLLLEFIGEQGLRLPKSLRGVLQRTPLYRPLSEPDNSSVGNSRSGTMKTASTSRSPSATRNGTSSKPTTRLAHTANVAADMIKGRTPSFSGSLGYRGDRGYVEEVDVEYLEHPVSNKWAIDHDDHSEIDGDSGIHLGSSRGSARNVLQVDRSHAMYDDDSHENDRGIYHKEMTITNSPGRHNQSPSKSRVGGPSSGRRSAEDPSKLSMSMSWARSSHSSSGGGGRYGKNEESEPEDERDLSHRRHSHGRPSQSVLNRSIEKYHNEWENELRYRSPIASPGNTKTTTADTSNLTDNKQHQAEETVKTTTEISPNIGGAAISNNTQETKTTQPNEVLKSEASSSINNANPSSTSHESDKPSIPESNQSNRIEEDLPGGRKRILYKNGTVKEIEADGSSLVKFLNGDTKKINSVSGTTVYYYAQADTTHTTFKDGLEVYEFPNKQVS